MRRLTETELAALAQLRQLPPEQRVIRSLQKGAAVQVRPSLPIEKIVYR